MTRARPGALDGGMRKVQVRCGPSIDVCNADGPVCLLLMILFITTLRREASGKTVPEVKEGIRRTGMALTLARPGQAIAWLARKRKGYKDI